MNRYDRSTFYGPASAVGYIDYPFYDQAKNNEKGMLLAEVAPIGSTGKGSWRPAP